MSFEGAPFFACVLVRACEIVSPEYVESLSRVLRRCVALYVVMLCRV